MVKTFVVTFLVLVAGGFETLACKNDWVSYEGSCYAFIDEKVTWATAREICRAFDSNLVEINDAAENAFLTSAMHSRRFLASWTEARHSFNHVWTGIQDFLREGTWVTTSNQMPVTYFNWDHGQPDNSDGGESGEDCIIVHENGRWDDYWCDNTHAVYVVCEYEMDGEVIG